MTGADIIFIGLLLMVLIPIAMIDQQRRRIPNKLNLLLGFLGFVHTIVKHPEWRHAVMAIASTGLAFVAFAATSWIVRKVDRNAKIGWGDLKFLIAASLWVGIDGSVAILFVASLLSIVIAIAQTPWRGMMNTRELRPFGPMLAIAMLAIVTVAFVGNAGP